MSARLMAAFSAVVFVTTTLAREPELEGFASLQFDGSNHRTPRWETDVSAAVFSESCWRIEFGGRYYFDFASGPDYSTHDPRVYASLQWTVVASEEEDFFLELILDTDAPSEMSGRGLDFSPSIKLEFKAYDELWFGVISGVPLATSPDPGSRAGYVFASGWVTWETAWLNNESDQMTLSIYSSTDEVRGLGNTLELELSYGFDVTDSLSMTVGVGSELVSPYPHPALFFAGAIEWKF